MKKKYFFTLILFAQVVFAQSNFTQPNPQIASPKPHHEFGEILEGQVVTHLFEITNSGGSELKITKVRASCGCTAVKPAQTTLKPGEKTTIKAEFDSHGRMGLQQKMIYVYSNDPKTPEYKLSFNATIVEKLEPAKDAKVAKLVLDKTTLDFGNVEEGKVVDAKIGFQNDGKGTLEIIDVKSSCGCTAALLSSKKLEPGQKGSIKIELDTANRQGKLVRTVTLFSNDPAKSNQIITLSANIEKRK